jgi:ribosomal protein S18 acetylase RimI-like enzyme
MEVISLRRMNSVEFKKYCQLSYEGFVSELAKSSGKPIDEARKEAGGAPIHSEGDLWYVVECDNEDAGYVWIHLLTEKPGRAFGYELHLFPKFRGRGLGRKTMAVGRNLLKQMGIQILEICAFAGNEVAVSLYRSLGFREISFNEARNQYRFEIVI